jgi:hypothetical protein
MTKWLYALICLRMRGETVIMENNSSPHKARNYFGIINSVLEYLRTEKTADKVAILVEGPDDVKVYRKFFDQTMTELFPCIGKEDLQKALLELLTKAKHVIGIRDADFCNLENIKPAYPNLFFTDGHDIEMTMLGFEEIRRALFSEYGDLNRIDSVWETTIKNASFAGYIRWFNEKNDYQIVFDGLYYKIDNNGDREQVLLDQLNEQSPDKKERITKEMIDNFIIQYKTSDVFNLCNGHDVIALLTKTFTINSKQAATALRLSFQQKQFIRTALYQELLAWQTDHGIAILYSFCEETDA